jgi:hypothetical protein
MDVPSSAAKTLAVIDMTANIASLLFNAPARPRMQSKLSLESNYRSLALENASEGVQRYLSGPDSPDGPDGTELETSQKLVATLDLDRGYPHLQAVEQRLHPGKSHKVIHRFELAIWQARTSNRPDNIYAQIHRRFLWRYKQTKCESHYSFP